MKAVLTIGGSDSGGGAGIQADLKTFEAFGVFGTSALTVLTAQNTTGVQDLHPVPASFVQAQIASVLSDFPIAAIKLGMLFRAEIIEAVEAVVRDLKGSIPVVLDPVAISRAGSALLDPAGEAALRRLFTLATVATPNRHEFARFIGPEPFGASAQAFVEANGCAVVAKNRREADGCSDWLFQPGQSPERFDSPIASEANTHGTGCTFAAALTAQLALGARLSEGVRAAKAYLYEAIRRAPGLGSSNGPIAHRLE